MIPSDLLWIGNRSAVTGLGTNDSFCCTDREREGRCGCVSKQGVNSTLALQRSCAHQRHNALDVRRLREEVNRCRPHYGIAAS